MQAHCILDVVSPAQQPNSDSADARSDLGTHAALLANVRVTPGMQPAHDISDLAWQGAHNHSGHNQQGTLLLLYMFKVANYICIHGCIYALYQNTFA